MNSANNRCIMTVKGSVENTELGFCHAHEHLFISKGQSYETNHSLWMDELDKTVAELRLFKDAGGNSIVDAQPVGCGRMEENLKKASELAGVNIIASTGFHKLMFYSPAHWINKISEEELANLYISELRDGMFISRKDEIPTQRTNIRPGIIKTATDEQGITGEYCKLFRAAARAAIATGAPILCHTEMGMKALETVEFLTGLGVKPERIILCHLDRVLKDTDYQLQVAATGVFMELDTIGRFKYHSDDDEARFILKLIEHGYEDKILLGLDTTRSRMKSYGGDIGLDYLSAVFLPILQGYGVPGDVIAKFMIANPSHAFYISAKFKEET